MTFERATIQSEEYGEAVLTLGQVLQFEDRTLGYVVSIDLDGVWISDNPSAKPSDPNFDRTTGLYEADTLAEMLDSGAIDLDVD